MFSRAFAVSSVFCLLTWLFTPSAMAIEAPAELTAFTFTEKDQKLSAGEYYHEFVSEVMAHSRIEITMASLAVTPYVVVEAANGEVIAETGDDGHPYRSIMNVTIPVGGPVRIVATTGEPDQKGTFLFQVKHLGDALQGAGNPRMIRGRFSKLDDNADRQRIHNVPVKAGEQLSVYHRSADYDAFLEVRTPDGRSFEDDDSGGDRNSMVTVTITKSGNLACIARPYGNGGTGSYTIEVSGSSPQEIDVVSQLGARRLRGTISANPGSNDPEVSAHRYAFIVEQPGTTAFLANWDNFDGRLELRDAFGTEIGSNDDAFGREWSALRMALEPGRYEIILSSYDSESSGGYELLYYGVEHMMRVGGTSTVVDELADGDDALEDARLADRHVIIGNKGERWAFDLSSDAFTPHVLVLGPDQARWDSADLIKSNRARLEIELPVPGLYMVVVTSTAPNQRGAYRLISGPSQAVNEHPLLDVRQQVNF